MKFPRTINSTYGVFLSKIAGTDIITNDEFRPIQIESHLFKVLEKYLHTLLNREGCKILVTGEYQAGFKPAGSTQKQVVKLMQLMAFQKDLGEKEQIVAFIDFRKAFDNINRGKLFEILRSRATSPEDHWILDVVEAIYCRNTIFFSNMDKLDIEQGVPQGAILSPQFFTAFLDHIIEDSPTLKEMRNRGQILAFADDIAVVCRTDRGGSAEQNCLLALNEFKQIKQKWGLEVNFKKTEVLTNYVNRKSVLAEGCKKLEVKIVNKFKYLGIIVAYNPEIMVQENYRKVSGILKKIHRKNELSDPRVAHLIWQYWVASYLRFYLGPFQEAGILPA